MQKVQLLYLSNDNLMNKFISKYNVHNQYGINYCILKVEKLKDIKVSDAALHTFAAHSSCIRDEAGSARV